MEAWQLALLFIYGESVLLMTLFEYVTFKSDVVNLTKLAKTVYGEEPTTTNFIVMFVYKYIRTALIPIYNTYLVFRFVNVLRSKEY